MSFTRRAFLEKSLAIGAVTFFSGPGAASPPNRLTTEINPLAFRHVTVIDATGQPALPDRTVVVVGDRIQTIGKFSATKLPKNATVIDASEKYMIPGLWDMHVHARGTPALLSDNEAWLTLYIANGITGVRGMGGDYAETVFRCHVPDGAGLTKSAPNAQAH